MTIGRRRQHNSVTVRKCLMISEKQKAKMHEAAQMQLFRLSDVQGELHTKQQQAASRKQRAAERKRRNICAEAHDQPQIIYGQWYKPIEEKTFVNQKTAFGKELLKEGGSSNEGFDHLLILANSAELLESEGQCHTAKSVYPTQENDDVKTGKNSLRVRGRIRLTQIRHQARLENRQPIQETRICHRHEPADTKSFEDINNGKSVDVDQVQGVTGHQDVQDSERGFKVTEDIRQLASLPETLKLNNEKLQQPSEEPHAIIPQPVQMTTECGEFTEQQSDATQVRTAISDDQLKEINLKSQQECGHGPLNYHMGRLPLLLKGPKDRHSIARERRLQRTLKRREQRYGAQFQWMANIGIKQMFEAQQWWMWHVMSAQNEQSDIAKQQWSLYMTYVEREKRRFSAQQRRAQKIEEQRASKNVYQQLHYPQPMEQSLFKEGPHNPNVGTGVEQDTIPVKVNESFQHPTIATVCEDKRGELKQHIANVEDEEKTSSVEGHINELNFLELFSDKRGELKQHIANVEDEESTSSVEGHIRLTRLKCEARLKNLPAERKSGKNLGRQRSKGEESRRS